MSERTSSRLITVAQGLFEINIHLLSTTDRRQIFKEPLGHGNFNLNRHNGNELFAGQPYSSFRGIAFDQVPRWPVVKKPRELFQS